MSTFFMNLFQNSIIETIYLVGVFIAIGLLLGVMERLSKQYIIRTFGMSGIMITAWLGTPIHEIGHLIQCILWRHKVTKVKLLQLPKEGIMGYVKHQYNPKSIYQQVGNFFIGLGPIFSGIGSLLLIMYLLIPHTFSIFQSQIHLYTTGKQVEIVKILENAVLFIAKDLFTLQNFTSLAFWIFLILALCISSHIALSRADIQNSAHGLGMIFILVFFFNIAAQLLGMNSSRFIADLWIYNAYVLAFSAIAVLLSFITLIVSFLFYKIRRI